MLKVSLGQKAVSCLAPHIDLFKYIGPFCEGSTYTSLEINNAAKSLWYKQARWMEKENIIPT